MNMQSIENLRTTMENQKKISHRIASLIAKELENNEVKCSCHIPYGGRGIQFFNTNTGLYIWIRVKFGGSSDIAKLDIANIDLPPKYRRKGIFTKVINKLKRMNCVSNIKIENVLTDEMIAWCKKHRFKECRLSEYDPPSFVWK